MLTWKRGIKKLGHTVSLGQSCLVYRKWPISENNDTVEPFTHLFQLLKWIEIKTEGQEW